MRMSNGFNLAIVSFAQIPTLDRRRHSEILLEDGVMVVPVAYADSDTSIAHQEIGDGCPSQV